MSRGASTPKGDILLAVDAGNTTIELGFFSGEKLLFSWHLTSLVPRFADEYWQSVMFFASEIGIKPCKIKRLALASVVPEHTRSLILMSERYIGSEPFIVSSEVYPYQIFLLSPQSVGADRLCSAVAGFKRVGGPLIVVDFGTAITLDVVAVEGSYLGGVILAGPSMIARSLHRRTAQLPEIHFQFLDSVVCKNTEQALQVGITWGIVDMIDGLIQRISRELTIEPKIICTGGYGTEFAKHSKKFTQYIPGLVLDGVRILYQMQETKF